MRTRALLVAALLVFAVLAASLAGCAKGEFIGSNLSSTFHDPSCVWAESIDRDREVWFADAAEADEYGYSPCSTCVGE